MGRSARGWPAVTLACFVAAAAAAVVNLTAVPVATHHVLLVLAGVSAGYGAVSRRRWLAAALTAAAASIAVAGILGWLPTGLDTTYRGPAGSVAPKLAWTAVAVLLALAVPARRRVPVVVIEVPDETALVRARLDALTARVGAVENALRS